MISVFYKEIFDKYEAQLNEIGVDVKNGFGDLESKIQKLDDATRTAIEADIKRVYDMQPELAMVNSDKGITGLHVPSDIIIDASMPAMIRTSGQMWGVDGQQQDTKAVIPDRCYSGVYQETINFCKEFGAFDPCTMGTVPNVGLMAKKAEEYGSHDKTFEIAEAGTVKVVNANGDILLEHAVEEGDIWRMCQVKDAPIQDWVKLAVSRARATGSPAIFWLDEHRAHDAQLIKKVNQYLANHDTNGLDLQVMAPREATRFTLKRIRDGKDTISVTGNVLRDYLTDLFPILELGTSAKMLSIVPLMNGGGLFETGAGGSAPKHVEQLVEKGHLRWDSLGEFLALAVSFEHFSEKYSNNKASILAKTLDQATEKYLLNNKSPSRKVGEPDNKASHFYVSMYWAQALAEQTDDLSLKDIFVPVAAQLTKDETAIITQLIEGAGEAVDIGGYYEPDTKKAESVMRPSVLFNTVIDAL